VTFGLSIGKKIVKHFPKFISQPDKIFFFFFE